MELIGWPRSWPVGDQEESPSAWLTHCVPAQQQGAAYRAAPTLTILT